MVSDLESSYPGGRMRVFRTFVNEKYRITDEFIRNLLFCTTCKRCENVCPIDLNYVEILEEVRKEVFSHIKDFIDDSYLSFTKRMVNSKNPYGEEQKIRTEWLSSNLRLKEKSVNGYFIGCTSSYREQQSAINTIMILKEVLNDDITILGNKEYCCGSPLIRTGQVNLALNGENVKKSEKFGLSPYILHNIAEIKKRGIQRLFFNCSGCFKTIKQDWPSFYGRELPFDCIHLTEFLADKITNGSLHFKAWNKNVTYHDPCHLGRFMEIYNEPRIVLKEIPQLKFVEMEHIREEALCCGAGGGLRANFSENALTVGKRRIKEAEATGAEVLVTACVFCKNNLQRAVNALESEIKVYNIEDIVPRILSK
jgi:heterodisulfide reductase subunit D